MPFSRYIKRFLFPEDPEYLLLYSLKTTSSALIHKSVMASVEDGTISASDEKILFDLSFLTDDIEAERMEVIAGFENANKTNRSFEAIVVINLDCNLDCVYCYEGELRGKFYMSQDTADCLVEFIEKQYSDRIDEIDIVFYGGEPLLSIGLIKYISEKLNVIASKKEIKFAFGLVTNGTLLTSKTAKELSRIGLKRARITIDGPPEIHDKFRPFKAGAGTFDIIVQNIKEAAEFIKINLGGNFTRDNYAEFPKLLDRLVKEGITPDMIESVRFDAITPSPFNCSDLLSGCSAGEEPWMFEAAIFLREEIMKRGFKALKQRPQSCQIEIDNSLTINYDGSILKCTAMIGWIGFEAGNIRTGVADYRESHKLDIWKNAECVECEYLPLCYGGCRYTTLLKDGAINRVDCRRQYYGSTLEALVKQDLKYSAKLAPQQTGC